MERQPAFVSRLFEWYLGPEGLENVDFVGRNENLLDDLIEVLGKLECRFDEDTLRQQAKENVSQPPRDPQWEGDLETRMLETEVVAIRRFYGEIDRLPTEGSDTFLKGYAETDIFLRGWRRIRVPLRC